jgi:hypothetical protein
MICQMGDCALATFHWRDPGVLCRRTLVLQKRSEEWSILHLHASNIPDDREG